MGELKQKTISGLIWSAIERFGYTLIMFISNLFLARLLSPNDFGVIAMIIVFISISSIIVDSGFGSALIQRKEINDIDYSTVFYLNILFACILYIFLYFLSSYIADFYNTSLLSNVLRILGLVLISNSLSIVQLSKLKRELNFKLISLVTIISSVLGSIVGIYMAFNNFGVWSLVFQTLSISVIKTVLLFIFVKWIPMLKFSIESFKKLFSYGSMILLSNIVDTIYTNTIPIITGKFFSANTLGNYTQARTLEGVPNQTLINIINQVSFPIFSRLQDNEDQLKIYARRMMSSLAWINFPIMILLIIIARPLFIILYTDKWIDAIPIFQIACLGGMLNCIVQINLSLLASLGNSKLVFYSRIVRQSIGLFLIVFGLYIGGLYGMMWLGVFGVMFVFCVIGILYTNRIMKYTFKEQIFDILPSYLLSIIVGLITFIINYFLPVNNNLLYITISVILYTSLYLFFSMILKLDGVKYLSQLIYLKKNEN